MFDAVTRLSYFTINSTIPFEIVRFNSGRAINQTTGVFKAPEEGYYFFLICGNVNEMNDQSLWIVMRKNEEAIGSVGGNKQYTTFSLYSILHLEKGDQVDLYLKQGAFNNEYQFTKFTGILLASSGSAKKSDQQTFPIHFYVQKKSSCSIIGKITYELIRVNAGNGMNINTGIFTAPSDGIYLFTLSGATDDSNKMFGFS